MSNDTTFEISSLTGITVYGYTAYGVTLDIPSGGCGGHIFAGHDLDLSTGTTFNFKSITGGGSVSIIEESDVITIRGNTNPVTLSDSGTLDVGYVVVTNEKNGAVSEVMTSLIASDGTTGSFDLQYNNTFNLLHKFNFVWNSKSVCIYIYIYI